MNAAASRNISSRLTAPEVSCDSSDALVGYEGTRPFTTTNAIDFDDLVGTESNPNDLFTCARQHASPLRPARYPHRVSSPSPPSTAPERISLADIAVGMPVYGPWLVDGQVGVWNEYTPLPTRHRIKMASKRAEPLLARAAVSGPLQRDSDGLLLLYKLCAAGQTLDRTRPSPCTHHRQEGAREAGARAR